MLTISESRRVSIMRVGIFFLCVTCTVLYLGIAASYQQAPGGGVRRTETAEERITEDWAYRQPGVGRTDLGEAITKWQARQPYVFKLHSDSHYLMVWHDYNNNEFSFSLNPADYKRPALTIEDFEVLSDPEFLKNVTEVINHVKLGRWKPLHLPDRYRLDDVCWMERYNRLCTSNSTGEVRVKLWQIPLSEKWIGKRPTLRLAGMYHPEDGQTYFNTFPGEFTLKEWEALTTNASIAEIYEFFETIED